MNVRLEYNQKDGNFHFNDITGEVGVGYRLISPNVNVDVAIEFTHHLSNKFEAFNTDKRPYPNFNTILIEFNKFVRKQ